MLIACLSVYNESQFIARCLESVAGKVDRIVVIDGAYRDFPHCVPYSTDGTIEIAVSYGAEVFKTETAYSDEIAKRNRYLIGDEGDYYVQIDGDEELIGSLPKLKDLDYQIELRRTDQVSPYPVYRVFAHREGIHYAGAHSALWAGGKLLNHNPMTVLDGCYLLHHTTERDEQRVKDKGTYYRKMQVQEMSFRKHYGL